MEHEWTWESDDIELETLIDYRCAEGTWFEHDRDQELFQLDCPADGVILEPAEWPTCVPSNHPHN